ncbi:MAG TPA: protein kinase [Pseudomonadales bacterium]|nr:protein kinase [Pseudomonadales bacterium]
MIRSFNLPDHEIVEGPLDGGMAHVYIARHTVLGRRVAIKVIRPEFVADSGFSARFVREARIVSRLHHPNVVTLYQVGERDGKPYYVMEYLAGGELKDRIHSSAPVGKTGQAHGARYACELTLAEVLRIAKDVAAALAVAHQQGYVHRDIKPSNIMFRADNSVVVTDFGIAKAIEPDKTQTDMTVTHGAVIGTPLYMSPEQVDASQLGVAQVDGRADLYSLGAVLYYALTGHPPFTADTPFQLGLKHLSASIPKLPPYLRHYQPVIQRCMAKRPADRFASAEAFVAELERLQKSHPRSAIPMDEPLPRFELPWSLDDGPTARLFDSVAGWLSPARLAGVVIVSTLAIMLGIWLATRTRTEDLLSVVETQQRSIDQLLAAPEIDFNLAFDKIEYTENLLKIQPNNPTSTTQLLQLQKKLEAGIYEEIANNQFEQAKQHISRVARYYASWSARTDLEAAVADAERKWNQQREAERMQALREETLAKLDAALAQHDFAQFSLLLEEAKQRTVSAEAISAREAQREEILAEERAQAEQKRQQRLADLIQQLQEAAARFDLAALDGTISALKSEGATDEQVQNAMMARQSVANELAEKARAEMQKKELERIAQLEEQQATGALERQYSVWQALNGQNFQTVSATRVQALKQRIEQRVTQLIRAEIKSGHYDVAEIWSNDARSRGMNLPWSQLVRPATDKAPAANAIPPAQSAAREAEPVPPTPPSAEPVVTSAPASPREESIAQARSASPPALPAEEKPPAVVPEVKPKSHSQPREVQVIGF